MNISAYPILSNKHLYFNFQVFNSSHMGPTYKAERMRKLMLWAYVKKKKQLLNTFFQGKGIKWDFLLILYTLLRFPYFNFFSLFKATPHVAGVREEQRKEDEP